MLQLKRNTKKKIWTNTERQAWSLPAKLTVSEWADKHRILESGTAEPGQWRTSRTPYLRGIMDSFCDPETEIITIVKSPQSGGTEALLNTMGYSICEDPGPGLMVMPRHEEDCGYMAGRLKTMVDASPELKRQTTGRIWDLTGFEFRFSRMTVYFSGANSPAGLGTKPIRYLWLDEIDKYPQFVGKEASPIDLAEKRTITFWDRKIVQTSTPTTTDGNIWTKFKRSSKHHYYIPCPHCGEYQVWIFNEPDSREPRLRIAKELREPDVIKNTPGCVWYECKFCRGKIDETEKDGLVARGEWLPDKFANEILKLAKKEHASIMNIKREFNYNKRHIGFQYNALISPWVSWTEVMAEWFEANTEEGVAVGKLLDFMNAILAEPYAETMVEVAAEGLRKNIGTFSRGTVPDWCKILVGGADYHEDIRGQVRIDFEVRGFGYGERNYVISCGSVYSWQELEDEILLHSFPWANPDRKEPELAVIQLFIDSGFKPDEVYEFCRRYFPLCMPTKGLPGRQQRGGPLTISSLEKITAERKAKFRGIQLALLDVSFFKDKVHNWASRAAGTPGSTEYFAEIPDYYFREFTNERKTRIRGRYGQITWQWRPATHGAQVHFLDTAVNAAAAAFYKRVQYMRAPQEQAGKPIPAALIRAKPVKLMVREKPEGKGFLDNLPEL